MDGEEKKKEKVVKKTTDQIKAENELRLKENSMREVSVDAFKNETTSERVYNGKFNKLYKFIRVSLVTFRAKKVTGKLSGKPLYDACIKMLDDAKTL